MCAKNRLSAHADFVADPNKHRFYSHRILYTSLYTYCCVGIRVSISFHVDRRRYSTHAGANRFSVRRRTLETVEYSLSGFSIIFLPQTPSYFIHFYTYFTSTRRRAPTRARIFPRPRDGCRIKTDFNDTFPTPSPGVNAA